MTSDELIEKVSDAGLIAVPIDDVASQGDGQGFAYKGELESFISLAVKLEAKFLLLATQVISEEDFIYETEKIAFDEEEADDETEQYYLPEHLPTLRNFVDRIGQEGKFRLVMQIPGLRVNFYHTNDWCLDLIDLVRVGIEKIDNYHGAAAKRQQKLEMERYEETLKKEGELLKKLKDLLKDGTFVRLPTLRAMQTYAIEKYPELEDVDPTAVSNEIANLSDRIKIKKLNKKNE